MSESRYGFGERERHAARVLIEQAIAEDLSQIGDITSAATIPSHARGAARVVARAPGVLAGLAVVDQLVAKFELADCWEPLLKDGDPLITESLIARIAGPMRSLLAIERILLNFLQRLSGIATLTAGFVAAVGGTEASIYDTRKTTAGWRALEKYAVRCGGGCNHRFGLYDAVLIKDNHLAWLEAAGALDGPDPIATAIATARANTPVGTTIEIEVDTLEQFERALKRGPDIILVDNLAPKLVAELVGRRDRVAPRVKLEASGGVNLATVRALAQTGVDRISVGALTHSAPALDLALDFDLVPSVHQGTNGARAVQSTET
jgi:nicotinate-nucleotide pyrophosphorylase (carboxylating)